MKARRTVEKWLPLGYFAAALALVMAVLPTVLRPPQQPPTQTAELSPDAPPDDQQQSIISALNRGVSQTAGQTTEGVTAEPGEGAGGGLGGRSALPRGCPRGYGNPPRQVESLYAAPCAAAFSGPNGGATAKGVTATEVRVALMANSGEGQSRNEGPVATEPFAGENAPERTYRVLQQYFNQNFQFYGRQLRLFDMAAGAVGETASQQAAQKADKVYDVFAAFARSPQAVQYTSQRGIIAWGGLGLGGQFIRRHDALLWNMDEGRKTEIAAEYICERLHGRPPKYNEGIDPTFDYGAPRRLGLIYYDWSGWFDGPGFFRAELAERCGADFVVAVGYNIEEQNGQSAIATAVARLRAEGVTTIVYAGEWVSLIGFTNNATSNGYFPEWFIPGAGIVDVAANTRAAEPSQASHFFGFTGYEIPRRLEELDCYRAYRSIDPVNLPHDGICRAVYPTLLQIANGIQMAGPTLTQQTFRQGLHRLGYRAPDPLWSVGGGFGPDDPSYTDYVSEIWWDATATDPLDARTPGAWRFPAGGRRFRLGDVPAEDPGLFTDGITTPSE